MKSLRAPHDFGIKAHVMPDQPCAMKGFYSRKQISSFWGWWVVWSIILTAVGSGCPCCGVPVCVGSGVGNGFLGAIMSWCIINFRKVQTK